MMVHASRAAHLLAKSPDWLKAAPMWENLLASWRQSGQKKEYYPFSLNHNAKHKRLFTTAGVDEFWFCGFSVIVWRAAGVGVASSTKRGCDWDRAALPR